MSFPRALGKQPARSRNVLAVKAQPPLGVLILDGLCKMLQDGQCLRAALGVHVGLTSFQLRTQLALRVGSETNYASPMDPTGAIQRKVLVELPTLLRGEVRRPVFWEYALTCIPHRN